MKESARSVIRVINFYSSFQRKNEKNEFVKPTTENYLHLIHLSAAVLPKNVKVWLAYFFNIVNCTVEAYIHFRQHLLKTSKFEEEKKGGSYTVLRLLRIKK